MLFYTCVLWGGDLFSLVRASDYVYSMPNVSCSSIPVAVYNLLFFVSCQSVLSVVFFRLILTLVVTGQAYPNLDHPLYIN